MNTYKKIQKKSSKVLIKKNKSIANSLWLFLTHLKINTDLSDISNIQIRISRTRLVNML